MGLFDQFRGMLGRFAPAMTFINVEDTPAVLAERIFGTDTMQHVRLFHLAGEHGVLVARALTEAVQQYSYMREVNAFYTPSTLHPGWGNVLNAPNPEVGAEHMRLTVAREVARDVLADAGLCGLLHLQEGPKRGISCRALVQKHATAVARGKGADFVLPF